MDAKVPIKYSISKYGINGYINHCSVIIQYLTRKEA